MIAYEFDSYNHRRYGRPWAAVVELTEDDTKLSYDFSLRTTVLADNDGDAGVLEIHDVLPNQVLVIGQKDYRGKKSKKQFFIVSPDGRISRDYPDRMADAVYHLRREAERDPDDKHRESIIAMIHDIMQKEGITKDDL